MKYVLVIPGRYTFSTHARFRMFFKMAELRLNDEFVAAMKTPESQYGHSTVYMIAKASCLLVSFLQEGVRIDSTVLELDEAKLGEFLTAHKRKLRAKSTLVILRGNDEVLWNDFGLALHPGRMWGTAYRADSLVFKSPQNRV